MTPSGSRSPASFGDRLRNLSQSDIFGGALLLIAAILALTLANSPARGLYEAVRDFQVGPESLHLHMSVGTWAADGVLVIFFFVVGLELKQEFVAGRLHNPRTAALPIAAAFGGVAVPAIIYTVINWSSVHALRGWAIPTATDIAFAVAVLAVVGRGIPAVIRIFLLTLAVVDDLIAIGIIAIFYAGNVKFVWLALSFIPLAIFSFLVRRGVHAWWILIPLGVATWGLFHASGIHATVSGVLLGFAVPVVALPPRQVQVSTNEDGRPIYQGMAAYFASKWGMFSTVVVVPIFAFFSAGVYVGGASGFSGALSNPITLGIILGLVFGKPIGILLTTFLLSRIPSMKLDPEMRWLDLTGMGFVAGVGFTVALLVGELSFGTEGVEAAFVKIGVLGGSFIAAIAGAIVLSAARRRRAHDIDLTIPVSAGHPNR